MPRLRPAPPTNRSAVRADIALLDAVISGMPDPVVVLDQDGRVIAFNAKAARDCAGVAPGRAGLDCASHARAGRGDPGGGPDRQVAAHRVLSAAAVAAAGRRRSSRRCGLAGGEASRAGIVVITVHDLTPIRRVEEMRADFVANASHELRTPLAALTGFIETLQGPARDDPAARERFLDIMQAQAWRMARLIDDLLVAVAHRAARASAARHAGRSHPDRATGGRRLADLGARPRCRRSRSPRRRSR